MRENEVLTIEKQNEFAFKATMILEIEHNLLVFVNDPSFSDKNKLKEYQVQVVFNAQELEKYAEKLQSYMENEKVKAFFDGYSRLKDNLNQTVQRISSKEILKGVKEFRRQVEEKVEQQQIDKIVKELSEQYGVSESELKIVTMKQKNKGINIALEFTLSWLFNIIILFSLSGLFNYASYHGNILNLLFFVLYYATIDLLLRLLASKYLSKYIFKTFGLVLILPLILTTLITIFLPIFVEIKSIFLFIITSVLVYLIRKFIQSYILEKIIVSKNKKKVNKNER